jgi:hypothetical protein
MLVVTQFLSIESRLNVEPAAARNLNRSEGGFNRSVGSKAEHNGWPLLAAKRTFPKSGKNYFSVHCHSAASVALADEVIE